MYLNKSRYDDLHKKEQELADTKAYLAEVEKALQSITDEHQELLGLVTKFLEQIMDNTAIDTAMRTYFLSELSEILAFINKAKEEEGKR